LAQLWPKPQPKCAKCDMYHILLYRWNRYVVISIRVTVGPKGVDSGWLWPKPQPVVMKYTSIQIYWVYRKVWLYQHCSQGRIVSWIWVWSVVNVDAGQCGKVVAGCNIVTFLGEDADGTGGDFVVYYGLSSLHTTSMPNSLVVRSVKIWWGKKRDIWRDHLIWACMVHSPTLLAWVFCR
jgi:hypothetical protein